MELATRLVALDEYDEEAHALLIRAHVAAAHRADARRDLAATLDRFRRDLGIEPSVTLVRSADPATGALTSRPGTSTRATAGSLIAAGEAAIAAGAIEAGLDTLRRAVADAEDSGDRTLAAKALVSLGEAHIHGGRGRDGEGATALHAALAAAAAIGDKALVSEACRELGYVEMKGARYDRADAWLKRAADEAPDNGLLRCGSRRQRIGGPRPGPDRRGDRAADSLRRRGGDARQAAADLANERTFLAWFRTGITLVALGLAAGQFLTRDLAIGVPLTRALGVLVVGLGIGILVVGRVRHRANRLNLDEGKFAFAKL